MKTPVVIPLDEKKVVLIDEDFLAIQITQIEADDYIKNLSEKGNGIVETKGGKIIHFIHLDEITSKRDDNEIDIMTKINGEYVIHTIAMRNLEERDKCLETIHTYIAQNFTRTVAKQKLSDAVLFPGICLVVVAVFGSFISWFSQVAQEPLQRTHIVKAWVALVYRICKFIGPTLPMILTGILLVVCLVFLGWQITHRPVVIMLEREKENQ
ncbi:MAG: hypothetical protein H6Q73_2252 [Firmicutes bacterium]|nr:hypothetical protein [Bacillota bacterium]